MKNFISFVNTSYGLNKIQNFFLFLTLFSVIIDPFNSFFCIKNISFILFFVCLAINFSSENINLGYAIATYKSFMFLFLILFVFDNKNYFKYFFLISLILAITICSIWLLVVIFPSLWIPFSYFFKKSCILIYLIVMRNYVIESTNLIIKNFTDVNLFKKKIGFCEADYSCGEIIKYIGK